MSQDQLTSPVGIAELATPDTGTRSVAVLQCRSCGEDALAEFLSLGSTPVANSLVDPALVTGPDSAFPLAIGVCSGCSLVQLMHEVAVKDIFSAEYPYYSSFSDSLVAHSARHVDARVADRGLDAGSFVVEIASNDGYLLQHFGPHGVPVLGIEPTPGPAAAARAIGIETIEEFFGAAMGARLRAGYGPADVVLAKNVLAHVPDLNSFVTGLAALVADDGIVQVENPRISDLLEHVEFDTIYHEHFCYFSTHSIQSLFARHGLTLLDVDYFSWLHGGTLRWTAGRTGTPTPAVAEHLAAETAAGLGTWDVYRDFGARVRTTQDELRTMLARLRAEGATIAAYGAAAKGATLLNSIGIDAGTIDFVVDRNPHKQGKLMPGIRIPILDPSELLVRRPDYVLLLAWNYCDEVMAQQHEYRDLGGRFIVPVPHAEIL